MNSLIIKQHDVLAFSKLSRKTILDCLTRIKIDHSINISEKELDAKINLIFEDCRDMSNLQFFENSEKLRKGNLFGKFPRNEEFKVSAVPALVFKINKLIGENLVEKIINEEITKIKLVSLAAHDKWLALGEDLKKRIISEIEADSGKKTKIIF